MKLKVSSWDEYVHIKLNKYKKSINKCTFFRIFLYQTIDTYNRNFTCFLNRWAGGLLMEEGKLINKKFNKMLVFSIGIGLISIVFLPNSISAEPTDSFETYSSFNPGDYDFCFLRGDSDLLSSYYINGNLDSGAISVWTTAFGGAAFAEAQMGVNFYLGTQKTLTFEADITYGGGEQTYGYPSFGTIEKTCLIDEDYDYYYTWEVEEAFGWSDLVSFLLNTVGIVTGAYPGTVADAIDMINYIDSAVALLDTLNSYDDVQTVHISKTLTLQPGSHEVAVGMSTISSGLGGTVNDMILGEVQEIRIDGIASPNNPNIIGDNFGPVGEYLDYTFKSLDPNQDDVKYYVEWGDGTNTVTDFQTSNINCQLEHSYSDPGTYEITAKAMDTDNCFSSDTTFLVTIEQNDDATITVTSPSGGEEWIKGSTETISWTSTGDIGTGYKLMLYQESTYIRDIGIFTSVVNSCPWTIPMDVSDASNYRVKIRGILDYDSIFDYSNYFTITHEISPPETSIIDGPSGTIDYDDVSFSWTGSDSESPTGNLLYSYMLEGYDGSWSPWASTTTKVYNDLADNSYMFQVKAKDEAGNIDPTPATQTFTVDLPYDEILIETKTGWNLITIPLQTDWMASDLLANVTSCMMVSWYDTINETYRTATSGGGYDFVIQQGHGYFVYVTTDSDFSVYGEPCISVSVPLFNGWNMIGWYQDYNTISSSLMENISGCNMISWYDTLNETYRTSTGSGYDFFITQAMGIFVYTTEASIWHGEG